MTVILWIFALTVIAYTAVRLGLKLLLRQPRAK
jgi:hypothetical protein